MINRVLIRIRVIQTLFSYYLNEGSDIKSTKETLLQALTKSYDLYFHFLALLIYLTDEYARRVVAGKKRLLPSKEDLNPNMALLDNRFIIQLRANLELENHLNQSSFDWNEHDVFIRNLLDQILLSDTYKEYSMVEADYVSDRNFWRTVFRQIICNREDLYNILEDESIYWNDDIDIVQSFTQKSIRQFEEANGEKQELLAMFRDESDKDFALTLIEEAIKQSVANKELIEKFAVNWETDRLANMDTVIMQTAIAEIKTFESIPISVSLNEYINIAKSYSTEKSPSFINGILDSVVKELKDQKIIFKDK